MMRRPVVLALLALGAIVALCLTPAVRSLVLLSTAGRGPAAAAWLTAGPRVRSVVTRVVSFAIPTAHAEEVLEFKAVPEESAAALEHRSRSAGSPATPVVPIPPTPPSSGKTGNIMRIGTDVHIEKDQVVSGDLLAMGGDVTVDGHVEGDVVAMGGDVHLSETARVDGDVACLGGELTEEPGASIGGQRVTAMGLRGKHALRGHRVRPERDWGGWNGFWSATRIASSFVWLFIFTVIAWGFASLAPGRTAAAHQTMRREPALSMGIGALVWALFVPSVVALALVIAILCITIIGIPLALAALFGYFVFLGILAAWGYAVSAVAVGEIVAARTRIGAPVITAPGTQPPTVSLSRKAVLGVLVLAGSSLVGEFLRALFFAPPLQGLGTFLSVISKIATIVAATFGAGALLRQESVAGTLRRWWAGRAAGRAANESPAPVAVPSVHPGVSPEPASPPPPA
jgi:hypothetical protein